SKMGSLTWDLKNFPKPVDKIAAYKEKNIAMMVIEESYISKGLEEYKVLDKKGFMAHDNQGNTLDTTQYSAWWGHGGMFDWTNKAGRDFWHDYRRQALINAGIAGHWTDLGEPEMHNTQFKYSDGLDHVMVHNSFNTEWLQSIYDGYLRNNPEKRPFMMSRSGGMGMQALGAVMWSGDTGSDFASLASQMPQQTHMMWSGLDYYSSDVGGFHRAALQNSDKLQTDEQAINELFTQWFAYSSLYEVPVRAHTENLCNCKETAPDRIGDIDSNRANINLRYQLLPYYYSLAFRATFDAEPVFPSLEYYYPNDDQAKNLGEMKMIGPFLLGSSAAAQGQKIASTYLPKGSWFDFRTGKSVTSKGQWVKQDLYINELFTLPLYVAQGALIPSTESKANRLKVFGFGTQQFDWYDDDGSSSAYLQGDYQQIHLQSKQKQLLFSRIKGDKLAINTLEWVLPANSKVKAVTSSLGSLQFVQQGEILTITLPKFKKELTVELTL
ncbi:MAG: alpha-glucosidase (family GH31 glycosyl hydrolase), partial [Psychromonas sp.]|uniref:glycoside hydrolase family 31 protein n=1 Tax=Psychromonas sp. TaxID=1884585 RepID=UPI0039E3B17F